MFITHQSSGLPHGFDNRATSLRLVGAADNWQEDRLTLYFSEYFSDGEEIVLGNSPQLEHEDAAASLIVTGCQPWTIFQTETYQGDAICVFPGSELSCTPGFYPNARSLSSLGYSVSSVRKGCFAKTKIYPPTEMNENKLIN